MRLYRLLFFLGCTCALSTLWAQQANPTQPPETPTSREPEEAQPQQPETPGQQQPGTPGQQQPGTPKQLQPGTPRQLPPIRPRPTNEARTALGPGGLIGSNQPLTLLGRVNWVLSSTVGVGDLTGGLVSTALSTLRHNPVEWRSDFDGYWQRYALRMSGSATSNTMEAGLGAIWGEDPRYRPSGKKKLSTRLWSIVKGAFTAHNREGKVVPAYARYLAISGSNVISNTWRPDSQRTVNQTLSRMSYSVLGRLGSNTFVEFLPEIKKLLGRR